VRRPVDPAVRIGSAEAMLVFAIVFVAFFFIGAPLQMLGVGGILAAQVVVFTLPVVAYAAYKAPGKIRETLAIRWPGKRDFLGAVLIGLSVWYVNLGVGELQQRIAPMPKELEQGLEQMLSPLVNQPLVALLAFAIGPAIVEELLCRALLARSFARDLGVAAAIVLSAAIFGILHLSLYRFVPQFLLGLSLAAITLATRSVIPSMIIHALHNALLLFAGPLVESLDWRIVGPIALVLVIVGHVVVLTPRREWSS